MTLEVTRRIDQIRHGIVPEGYKKTKAGIVPAEWAEYTIADCLKRVERPVEVKSDEMYTQIGIRSHGKGLFYKEPVNGKSLGNKSVFWIEPDCFVLNIVFAWEQAIGKTTQKEVGMIGSHRFPMYQPISERVDIDYLISYLMTKRGKDILEAASPGGAGRNRTLGQDRFMNSKIVLPTLTEQKRIASILTMQDKLIELEQQKIEEIKKAKRFYFEKMFPKKGQAVPEIRFKGFTNAWEQRKVDSLFEPLAERNDDLLPYSKTLSVATMTYKGVGNGAADSSLANYKRLRLGDIAFEGHTSKEFRYGRFVLNDAGDGIMSPRFSALRPVSELPIQFWKHYIHYEPIMERLLVNCTKAGTMMNELVVPEFLRESLLVPSTGEQMQIGQFFTTIDTLIILHQRKLEEEKRKKKALMQLLLTGLVRVNA